MNKFIILLVNPFTLKIVLKFNPKRFDIVKFLRKVSSEFPGRLEKTALLAHRANFFCYVILTKSFQFCLTTLHI